MENLKKILALAVQTVEHIMKLNKQLLQINRNFIICFIASASLSAVAAQLLAGYENYQTTTITIIIGYVSYTHLTLPTTPYV